MQQYFKAANIDTKIQQSMNQRPHVSIASKVLKMNDNFTQSLRIIPRKIEGRQHRDCGISLFGERIVKGYYKKTCCLNEVCTTFGKLNILNPY